MALDSMKEIFDRKPSQVAFLSELPGVLSMTYYDKEEDDDGSGFDEGNI